MSTVVVIAIVAVATLLACTVYRRARRRATPRLPPQLADELRAHKLECLGEPAARVELELRLLLGPPPPAGARSRIVAAARDRLARVAPDLRRTGTVARRP